MNNNNKLIRNFLARICEKNYSGAESLLQNILVEKMKDRVKKEHKKAKSKKNNLFSDKDKQ